MLLQTILATAFLPLVIASSPAPQTAGGAAPPVAAAGAEGVRPLAPRVTSTTTYRLRQTVRLVDIAPDARTARLWVPIPSDTAWQRVLDVDVVDAPTGWRLERQDDARGAMIFVAVDNPGTEIAVTVEVLVERDAVATPMRGAEVDAAIEAPIDPVLFASSLRLDAPLMEATPEIMEMAAKATQGATTVRAKVARLLAAVADRADHYSKDPTKPVCGRGSAADCLTDGGGCCTNLHALFIAMARAQGIPARIQFGYRLTPANEGKPDVDPGYRCWVEAWIPGSGWTPTDIVVADGRPSSGERDAAFGTLDDRRVWLWEGRSHRLAPANESGVQHTMLVGLAEVDGRAVDPLPAADGTPSKLRRSISFTVVPPPTRAAR
jgi:transglutaminase-like putative cysteine protease